MLLQGARLALALWSWSLCLPELKVLHGSYLLVESVGASPKPGPTEGRPLAPGLGATARPLLDASSRRTRTEAGTIDVTVLSSCGVEPSQSAPALTYP